MAKTVVTGPDIKDGGVGLSDLGALTAKGDLLTRSASAHVRFGVGSGKEGAILLVDSNEAEGIRWENRVERHDYCAQTSGQSTTPVAYGGAVPSVNTPGALAATYNDANGWYNEYQTNAAAASYAGWRAPAAGAGFATQLRYLPDATWVIATGDDITSQRFWAFMRPSLTDAAPDFDTGSVIVGFRYSTVAGDANWKAVCDDAVGTTATDTGVVVAVDTRYVLRIRVVSTAEIEFYINGNLVATITTDIPNPNGSIYGGCQVIAQAASKRKIRIRKMQAFQK